MNTIQLNIRVLGVLGKERPEELWEQLMLVYKQDREAFYELVCRGVETETAEELVLVARHAHVLGQIIRESYSIVPIEDGAFATSYHGLALFIPAHLVKRVSIFACEVDGKTSGPITPEERMIGQVVSKAEADFKCGTYWPRYGRKGGAP